ncbi:MAG: DUF5682 family protein [Verrucomicrobiota bacterium]|nr:DUF5682 family protein [Verrucomicrobiota bacterium]
MAFHILGVRHHGPGSARSVQAALNSIQPDVILLEGPPEADSLVGSVGNPELQPPVALLLYVPDAPQRAVFYPFASFSPEWQALRYANTHSVPLRFMDLPMANQLLPPRVPIEKQQGPIDAETISEAVPQAATIPPALANEEEVDDDEENDSIPEGVDVNDPRMQRAMEIRMDPIGFAARLAGYSDGERWWEHLVEQRQNTDEVFAAVMELMQAMREDCTDLISLREQRREATMRQTMRATQKEGFQKIAVICGAWHGPALLTLPPAKHDNEILKGLPKVKIAATWIPWSHGRLARASGYGAGVNAPGWYQHLFNHPHNPMPGWMSRAARVFRAEGQDGSPAHAIEATRLADTLASLRGAPLPGLPEAMEAIRTIYCFGQDAPLRLLEEKLLVNEKLGKVPDDVPQVPIATDLAREQKRLRMPPEASHKVYDLDLRKPNDLDRSRLLHRLNLLSLPWGKVQTTRGKSGTFHEIWNTLWKPEFALTLIEASTWGNTLMEAAASRVFNDSQKSASLPELTTLLDAVLLAHLPESVGKLLERLQNVAAVTTDLPHLMEALPPLANINRYGDIRQTDTSAVAEVVSGLVARICVGLVPACSSMNDEAAKQMSGLMGSTDQAVSLLENTEHATAWNHTLEKLSTDGALHGLVTGRATRILFDRKLIPADELNRRMSLSLSTANGSTQGGYWLEGFLSGSGLVLLHHPDLLKLVDAFIGELGDDHFTGLLPLLRRTFTAFSAPERRQIGEHLLGQGGTGSSPVLALQSGWDSERSQCLLPTLRLFLGLNPESLA